MADPKIRYDIQANATGEADVSRLATQLEKLDDAIDPQAAASAKMLGRELQSLAAQQSAVRGFLEALAGSNAASKGLDEAQVALQRLERRLQSVEAPTRAQAGQLEKLRDAAVKAQAAFTQQTEVLSRARGELDKYGLSTQGLGETQQRLAQGLRTTSEAAQGLIGRYQLTAQAAKAGAEQQVAAQRTVSDSLSGINRQLGNLQALAGAALGGSFVGQIAGDVARTADAYNNLAARLKLVTGEGQAFDSALQGVLDVATRTGTALETTGNLFTRIAQAGKEFGLSQRDALSLTESINQAVQVSGASAQASDAAITQLIQGLQSGVLRGEEFNSVMEQAPRLAQALAAGVGVTTGELRSLAQQGALTSETVVRALQGQAAALKREFDQLPPTVGRALQNLQTQWTAYIGQQDQATGSSAAAAKALDLLGKNLSEIASTLKVAGEAWLAYKLLDLANTLGRQALGMQVATAATAANTVATGANTVAKGVNAAATKAETGSVVAHTVATVADTTATVANTAARGQAVGALATALPTAQRIVGLVGTLARLGGAVGAVVTVALLLKDAVATVGHAMGEGLAKLMGWADGNKVVESALRAEAEAASEAAAEVAALAAQQALAEQKVLNLSEASKALVADFAGVVKKTGSTAKAMEDLAKAMDLRDVKGIDAAVSALDALRLRGALTAKQMQETLGQAFKDLDLVEFEKQAHTAFDGTARGARRLQIALDAVAGESLRRVGTSVEEMATGFNRASTSAVNDVDVLANTLRKLRKTGEEASPLLAKALDKAAQAASTEKAVQAVIDRMKELAKQGLLSGDDLVAGLDKASKKLDTLTPGIKGLAEAYAVFGIKTKAELQAVADKNRQAWQVIKNDATSSLAVKQQAFTTYAESAIAANGGVADSSIKNEAQALKVALQFDATGKAIVKAMEAGDGSIKKTTKLVNELGEEVNKAGERINQVAAGISGQAGVSPLTGVRKGEGVRSAGGQDNRLALDGGKDFSVLGASGSTSYSAAGSQLLPPDDSGKWTFVSDASYGGGLSQSDVLQAAAQGKPVPRGTGLAGVGYWKRTDGVTSIGADGRASLDGKPLSTAPAPAPAPASASGGTTNRYVVDINLAGSSTSISTSSAADAEALTNWLKELQKRIGG